MGIRSDYTGIDQTCPYINTVRDFIEGIEWSDDEENLAKGAKEACVVLEQIRQMNSDLRDFGNKQAQELEEMEKDRDYYQRTAENHEKEIEWLKEEIRNLQKEISEA